MHGIDPATGVPVGNFVEVNDATCQRLGYSRAELLRMAPADIDDPATPTIDDAVRGVASTGGAVFERIHVASDGRRIPVEINTRAFHDHGLPLVLSIVRDITERKVLEEDLRRSNAELEQFAFVASHDLRSRCAWSAAI